MVKSVLSVAHQGLRDWVLQRVSAIIVAVYSITLISYIVMNPELTYSEWRILFAETWVKVGTLMFVLALSFHAWIGMWTIYTDYIKCAAIRCVMHVGTILLLLACFLWAVIILWSV